MNRSTVSDQTFGPARAAPHLGMTQAGGSGAKAAEVATAPLLLALFIFSILPPIYFHLGETRLSPTRIVLLVLFLPLAFRLFSGTAGRLRAIDILLFLFSGWMVITILYSNGIARIPLAVSTLMEMLGGYLVGRTLVRNATDYRIFLRHLVFILLVLLPFSVLEHFTNVNLLQKVFDPIFNVLQKPLSQSWRNGFSRVMSGFEHPILYGLFCAMTVAPIYYFYKDNPSRAICYTAIAVAMTYMSLSSAPLIAVLICLLLITWDHVTGSRWKLLVWIAVSLFVFLSVASNRGPLVIMIDYLTFNPHTAWTRIWTFNYGSIQVMEHPFFGMGVFEDWPRPRGLTPSVDNFWLLVAMRHGLVGFILLALALVFGMRAVIRAKISDRTLHAWRTGYVVALVGLYFSLATVHMWGDTSAFIMCFIGAGMWFCTAETSSTEVEALAPAEVRPISHTTTISSLGDFKRSLPTTRFARNHTRKRE